MKIFRIIKNFFVILAETAIIKKFLIGLVTILVIWYLFSTIISFGAWKAVFLENGQVFFGKFVDVPFSQTITLREVFYIQDDKSNPATTTFQVARIINDVQGPTDKMVITKDKILYFEILRSTSPFVKGLNQEVAR